MGYRIEKWKIENGRHNLTGTRNITERQAILFIERAAKCNGTDARVKEVLEGMKAGWTYGAGRGITINYTQEATK